MEGRYGGWGENVGWSYFLTINDNFLVLPDSWDFHVCKNVAVVCCRVVEVLAGATTTEIAFYELGSLIGRKKVFLRAFCILILPHETIHSTLR